MSWQNSLVKQSKALEEVFDNLNNVMHYQDNNIPEATLTALSAMKDVLYNVNKHLQCVIKES